MSIILVPTDFGFDDSISSDGFRSFDKKKENSNSFDVTKLFPTPKQNETAQQIASNIETIKQRLSKSKETLEIFEKNWNKIIAEFEIISTDNKFIIAPS